MVRTPVTCLGAWVCSRLEEAGHTVSLENQGVSGFTMLRNPDVPFGAVSEILDVIRPIIPPRVDMAPEKLDGHDLCLEMFPEVDKSVTAELKSDSTAKLNRMRRLVRDCGASLDSSEFAFIDKNQLIISPDLDPFHKALAFWIAESAMDDFQVEVQDFWSGDEKICLSARDVDLVSLPMRARYPVQIEGDDPDSIREMSDWLKSEGFIPVVREDFEADPDSPPRLEVVNGPFRGCEGAALAEMVSAKLRSLASQRNVDNVRYPVRVHPTVGDQAQMIVRIPMRACVDRTATPWSGPTPDRFNIVFYTDNFEAAPIQEAVATLRGKGFLKIQHNATEPLTTIGRDEVFRYPAGRISFGDLDKQAGLQTVIQSAVQRVFDTFKTPAEFQAKLGKDFHDDDFDVFIPIPVEGMADGRVFKRLNSPENYDLTVYASDPTTWEPVIEKLKRAGFHVTVNTGHSQGRKLIYGSAYPLARKLILDLVKDMSGTELVQMQQWNSTDRDIHLHLPDLDKPLFSRPVAVEPELPFSSWPEELDEIDESDAETADPLADAGPSRAGRPFIHLENNHLWVGQTRLPVRRGAPNPLTRRVESMAHYCLDPATAATLVHLARSVALGEPCLLEGETSTSKTSSIEYLAAHLNQPVLRINLNGQTDTGDLIGRFIPQNLVEDLPLTIEELLHHEELLETESRIILRRAAEEARELTAVEIQQVMANERMRSHPWRWQDGGIIQALRHGYWVILDEVNLAEPQILERLNSLLEFQPSLVLSEFDNTKFGSGGVLIHPDFRIFATMNPAEYAGRSAMSPAYKDRWRGYRLMEAVREAGYHAMLRHLVFGEGPEITLEGHVYEGVRTSAVYGEAGRLHGIGVFLECLARFHGSMESAAGQGQGQAARIGARRKEKLVFTRRGLVSVIEFMDREAAGGADNLRKVAQAALARYYLSKVPPGEDLQAALALMDACGIGERSWSPR